ncbi:MAG: sarcosine oxidase subunit gamma family protein [Maritimibacter sp.]
MSEAKSVLNGATFDGFCKISDAGLVGMVTIRGELGDKAFAAAVKKAIGLAVPEQGAIVSKGDLNLAWMSSDELMLFCAYENAGDLAAKLDAGFDGLFAMAVNVSDMRAVFSVEGEAARDVIAKLSPANVAPGAFGPGQMRRTRLSQVAAGFYMPDENSFRVIAFRSVGQYVFDILKHAAAPGSEVGHFA